MTPTWAPHGSPLSLSLSFFPDSPGGGAAIRGCGADHVLHQEGGFTCSHTAARCRPSALICVLSSAMSCALKCGGGGPALVSLSASSYLRCPTTNTRFYGVLQLITRILDVL
uniref:Uncharacterized protein n=1 Tax=Oryza sativa subsp. japonica TaxID=39947 RepID=Q5SML3_ORYSJ|nr:hypothetical protein [Oryza sativa Japonica Group]BAD72543.1 hypothetical protein [Oryza sativa Japonica Group]